MKICSRCKLPKTIEEFDKHKRNKDGRVSRCKVCRAEVRALPDNAKVATARSAAWREVPENKTRHEEWQKKNYQDNREERLHGRRQYLYKVSPEQFEQMKTEQDNKCKICGTSEPGGRGNWHVDHNHETDVVRALLCHECNTGLGKFKDSPELLIAAAQYLQQHNGDSQCLN